ncbi:MAG: ribose-phosphate pyrophosphokinase-like domain-containing protein [Methylocystis sp.]|nr:ribose-phosphate pyrophosphokinase-like domain-containing protein [Methylocystis sp.]
MSRAIRLFALASGEEFGARVAGLPGHELSPYEERSFEDGEFKIRPLDDVRSREIYVVYSVHDEKP